LVWWLSSVGIGVGQTE